MTVHTLPGSYRKIASLCGAGAALLGLLALLGWILGMPLLASIRSSFIPMAPVTAVALLCLGGLLLVQITSPGRESTGFVAAALSALLSAYGLIELVEYMGVSVLSLEEWLFPNPPILGAIPTGRMSPVTAAMLLFSGAVVPMLVLHSRGGERQRLWGDLAGCLGSVVAVTGLSFLLAYLHGAPLLYGGKTIPVAATTAFAFLLLGAGQILAAGKDSFPVRSMAGPSARAMLLRVFVSTTVVVVLAIDLLHLYVPYIFFRDDPFLSGISVMAFVVIAGGLIARVALKVGGDMDRSEAVRRQAEDKLRESEKRYRLLFDEMQTGFALHEIVCDPAGRPVDYRFLQINPAFERLTGLKREVVIGKTVREILPHIEPVWIERYGEVALTGKPARFVEFSADLNRWYETTAFSHGKGQFAAIFSDITERKTIEERLRQSLKMEAVGRLAGGIAHDFNNLLTVINGYSELILNTLPEGAPLRKEVEEIRGAGERAEALTRQLLAFGRKQVLQPKVLDLNAVLAGMKTMLGRLITENIDLLIVPGKDLGNVKADAGQLGQVIVNLALNSRDAMPGGGRLTIETMNVDLDKTSLAMNPSLAPGPYVLLSVSDTGAGMDEETRAHAFEPFFTTKEKGKGTGLGLSTVHGIVHQSGGQVSIYSEAGKGTTIKVYLPLTGGEAEAAAAPALDLLPVGRETILLVEDEEAVRQLVKEVLVQRGYTVLEAQDGAEAISVCSRHEGPLDLLVTDVVMPRMGGQEIAARLASRRPGMKILYMSGYTDNAIVHHGVLDPGTAFLQKPFTPDALARKVREVLDADHA